MQKLILRSHIERSPQAIAPNWYFLEPGQSVFLVRQVTAVCFMVSEVENPAERLTDDIFMVSASELETVAA
jgi:hypothetical protein